MAETVNHVTLNRLPHRSSPLHTEAAGTAPPDAFGPFRVLHQIGAGTLGPVFRAYDAERERLVAIKLFKLDLPPDRVHRFVGSLEQLIAAGLTHPAMAVPLAAGLREGSAYLAQDYVAAESLDAAVREYGPAPPADALRVAAQLAGALDFAAAVGITHGALHPRDVLLSTDETRLTGIGVAHALESVGAPVPVRRPYTAPERLTGAAGDRRADVFGLAALLHEMLWGRRVSGTGSQAADSLTKIEGGDLDLLREAFSRALADDPAARFSSSLELVDSLRRAFPDVSVSEHPAVNRKAARAIEPRLPLDDAPIAAPSVAHKPTLVDPRKLRATTDRLEPAEPAGPRELGDAEDSIDALELRASDSSGEAKVVDEPREPEPRAPFEPPEPREPVRSSVSPLMAAVLIGLAIGFAGGYVVGLRDHSGSAATVAQSAGTEATEVRLKADTPTASAGTTTANRGATTSSEKPASADQPSDRTAATVGASRAVPSPTAAPSGASRQRGEATKDTAAGSRTSAERAGRDRLTRARAAAATRQAARTPERSSAVSAASGTAGRFVGGLIVDSRPTGARVFLDGKLVGTTPMTLESVGAGEHAIRLERDGYRRWSSSVRIVASEKNRVTASLER